MASKARDIADLGSNDVLETTATGLDVTGTVTADGLKSSDDIEIAVSSVFGQGLGYVGNTTSAGAGTMSLYDSATGGVTIDGFAPSYLANSGVVLKQGGVKGFHLKNNNNVEFYEDTGTTAKMVWSSSAESLGIGTSVLSNNSIITEAHIDNSSTNGVSRLRLSASGENMEGVIAMTGYLGSDSLTFSVGSGGDSSATERMRIDSAGNVGIGTASPDSSAKLQIRVTSDQNIGFQDAGGNPRISAYNDAVNASLDLNINGANLKFETGGTERARIDSSGNLLVGTTDSDLGYTDGDTGVMLSPLGFAQFSRDSSFPTLYVQKLNNDGSFVDFNKDGLTVGSIRSVVGLYTAYDSQGGTGYLGLAGSNTYAWDSARIYPSTDNARDLGLLYKRFDDIYATNGTIQTSDRNEKQDIEVLNEAEQRVAQACKGLLRKFRWKDSVAEKGDDARIHFGIIAQDLQDAFTAEGLDAGQYAMFISTTWTDEETGEERTRLGVRYPELLAFIISAL